MALIFSSTFFSCLVLPSLSDISQALFLSRRHRNLVLCVEAVLFITVWDKVIISHINFHFMAVSKLNRVGTILVDHLSVKLVSESHKSCSKSTIINKFSYEI